MALLLLSLPNPLTKSEDMLDRAIQSMEMDSPVKPENDDFVFYLLRPALLALGPYEGVHN